MKDGLVSVVVPVYNAEAYLNICVDSIVKQSYRNLEIILVDDGSTDRSPAMCDEWAAKDCRIRVIHKKNAGAGYARNSGLAIATGAYICFFDSDDYPDRTAVEKAYTLAKKSCADIVIFGSTTVDQYGDILHRNVPETEKLCYRGEDVRDIFLPDLISGTPENTEIGNLSLSLWTCMFSMELIRRCGWQLVSEREFASEDSYSLISLYRHVDSVAILQEALYFYRVNIGSLSHSYKEDAHIRMKQFYLDCLALATDLGYSDKVQRRIADLFLSQEIGIMKQIVSAERTVHEKRKRILEIVQDDVTQRALREINWCERSWMRRTLLFLMRKKLCGMVYCAVLLQVATSR